MRCVFDVKGEPRRQVRIKSVSIYYTNYKRRAVCCLREEGEKKLKWRALPRISPISDEACRGIRPCLTIQQPFLCCFFVNGLTPLQNPAMLPDAVSGIYPTNCCLTGA